jgi:hypothetical protein
MCVHGVNREKFYIKKSRQIKAAKKSGGKGPDNLGSR